MDLPEFPLSPPIQKVKDQLQTGLAGLTEAEAVIHHEKFEKTVLTERKAGRHCFSARSPTF
ncbi:MAG: hypothetical protein WCF90_04820 [Methanomicrobiales archaeon]